MQTLLERFGIPQPKSFDDYNLIGIEFGDEEISTSVALWNELTKKMSVSTIRLDPGHVIDKAPNAFYISENVSMIASGVNNNRFSGKDGSLVYYNFMVCPGDQKINAKYRKDGVEKGYALTYGQAMAKSFSCLVNLLFDCNEVINRRKPTIILVDRPTGADWAASEQAYARLLREGLQLPQEQKPVYVAVQAEPTAVIEDVSGIKPILVKGSTSAMLAHLLGAEIQKNLLASNQLEKSTGEVKYVRFY